MTPVIILRQGGTNSTNKKHISPQVPHDFSTYKQKKYTSVIYLNMHICEQHSSKLLRKQKGEYQYYLNKKKREVNYTILIVLKSRIRGAIKI